MWKTIGRTFINLLMIWWRVFQSMASPCSRVFSRQIHSCLDSGNGSPSGQEHRARGGVLKEENRKITLIPLVLSSSHWLFPESQSTLEETQSVSEDFTDLERKLKQTDSNSVTENWVKWCWRPREMDKSIAWQYKGKTGIPREKVKGSYLEYLRILTRPWKTKTG